ncbi:MAG: monovalent cation/H(+) antiporter subunit G [Tissierellales bacterium]|jgi:multicomponent Na+:H+ antiporter subunit G|nr:monovalent cation/H(+) antiporter subunit G [Tissierellales bacterium]
MIDEILIVLAWCFLLIGLAGLFRLKGIYEKLLNSSKIDSVTFLTLMLALIVRSGWSEMSLKLVIILIFYLMTNPIASQIVASSAYKHGIEPKDRK